MKHLFSSWLEFYMWLFAMCLMTPIGIYLAQQGAAWWHLVIYGGVIGTLANRIAHEINKRRITR
ncbi:MAG TPA: hypothetical protein VFT99_12645 [Roseiflexaceae bacterium]|nr:hypothetical protein [Roseiflexaceae bacterium]